MTTANARDPAWGGAGGGGGADVLFTLLPTQAQTGTKISQAIAPGAMVGTALPLDVEVNITKTDTASPFTLLSLGANSSTTYGDSTHAAVGTVGGVTSTIDVIKSGDPSSEHAAFISWIRYGSGATPGRAWMTDFSLHGALGVQQQLLTGINMLVNNYYNGSPSDVASSGIHVISRAGTGGGADAAHQAATTYPVDVGIGVSGKSGVPATALTRGFTTAIKVGGTGGGWGSGFGSLFGTGIDVADWETAGVHVSGRAASATGPSLKVTNASNLAALDIRQSGDTLPRFASDTLGKLEWSGGGGVVDANLYRTAANYLQSDFVLVGVKGVWGQGGVINKTKAGIPVDGDLDTTVQLSGACILDTTNSRIYFRVGTTWKYAALT